MHSLFSYLILDFLSKQIDPRIKRFIETLKYCFPPSYNINYTFYIIH